MVCLYLGGRLALRRGAFDYIRIERALRQEIYLAQLGRLVFEDLDELLADGLALFLRVDYPLQLIQEHVRGIHVNHVHLEVLAESVQRPFRLLPPQQSVVDENAGKLVADSCMHQRGRYR